MSALGVKYTELKKAIRTSLWRLCGQNPENLVKQETTVARIILKKIYIVEDHWEVLKGWLDHIFLQRALRYKVLERDNWGKLYFYSTSLFCKNEIINDWCMANTLW